jgi:hypothetical protein
MNESKINTFPSGLSKTFYIIGILFFLVSTFAPSLFWHGSLAAMLASSSLMIVWLLMVVLSIMIAFINVFVPFYEENRTFSILILIFSMLIASVVTYIFNMSSVYTSLINAVHSSPYDFPYVFKESKALLNEVSFIIIFLFIYYVMSLFVPLLENKFKLTPTTALSIVFVLTATIYFFISHQDISDAIVTYKLNQTFIKNEPTICKNIPEGTQIYLANNSFGMNNRPAITRTKDNNGQYVYQYTTCQVPGWS